MFSCGNAPHNILFSTQKWMRAVCGIKFWFQGPQQVWYKGALPEDMQLGQSRYLLLFLACMKVLKCNPKWIAINARSLCLLEVSLQLHATNPPPSRVAMSGMPLLPLSSSLSMTAYFTHGVLDEVKQCPVFALEVFAPVGPGLGKVLHHRKDLAAEYCCLPSMVRSLRLQSLIF